MRFASVLIGFWIPLFLMPAAARAQRVVWEQRFDTPASLQLWEPNGDLDEMRIEAGALHCRGICGDPLMIYRPIFEFATSPLQAVEVRMKADHDGTAQIFWTNTTVGRYGGFTGEKRTEFAVRGDGAFHTYRVLPFWQKEQKIIKFRFDPYQGARFAIESIRVVEWRPEAAGSEIDFRRGAEWLPIRAVSQGKSARGLELTMQAPDGMAAGLVSNLDSAANSIISLQITTSTASRATLLFGSDEAYGLHQLSFTLQPDGKSHVYNLDMLSAPEWHGRIVALGIRPGERAGDGIVLEKLQVGSAPKGPADLRALWFGVEETLPRAGLPMTILARFTNTGGVAVRGLDPQLVLPADVRLVNKVESKSTSLAFREEREQRWRVIAAKPGDYALKLDVGATEGSRPAHSAFTVKVTNRPSIPPAAYVPVPHQVKPGIEVGAYYFPGWKSAGQWAPITRFPERRPALGWYREGDPEIADWQIKWAVEHGITFFAYDWYWQQGAQQLDHALKDGLFKARYREMLKFCLLWANHNAAGSSSLSDCLAVTDFWIKEYFGRLEYLRIDGKPVVIIFSPYRFREDMGSDNVRMAFNAMRAKCSSAVGPNGVPVHGIYLIACVNSVADAKLAEREGYDAVTAYNWPGLGITGNKRSAPFADLLDGYKRQWESLIQSTNLPLMTPVSGGWDNRPWAGDGALVRSGRTPQLFKRHLQDADGFIKAHPQSTLPFVLAEAWNEWGEGSYIEPHQQFGFGYLDAIRDVFAPGAPSQPDITPQDVGRPAAQVKFGALTQSRWSFISGLQGWESGMQVTAPKIADGSLVVTTIGIDPAIFGPPVQISAESHPVIHLRVRAFEAGSADSKRDMPPLPARHERSWSPRVAEQLGRGGEGRGVGAKREPVWEVGATENTGRGINVAPDIAQVFWTTRTAAESEVNSVRFPLAVDGQWHDYRIRLADNPRWRSLITRLRFDPVERSGVVVQVSVIELIEK